jgi:hypothetical protein
LNSKIRPPIRYVLWIVLTALLAMLVYSIRLDLEPPVRRLLAGQARLFADAPLPASSIEYVYDMGVTDVDNDGRLDLYTANHNYQQFLWLAMPEETFRDVVDEWKLGQSPEMPGIEQSKFAPAKARPGLYIYWIGDTLHLQFHAMSGLTPARGTARFYNLATIVSNEGVEIRENVSRMGAIPETLLEFSVNRDAHLVLYPLSRGAPARFRIDAPWARSATFVGQNAVVPPPGAGISDAARTARDEACPQCLDFEMTLLDRHSMAWSDINHDGRPDVFINRGALGGMLRRFPQTVRDEVSDEMLVSQPGGGYHNLVRKLGIEKKDCSGRHVRWVDFDQDGRLDLFINCQDRGNVPGGYPKQVYRQLEDGRFEEVAAAVGLALPEHQLVDMVWFDADGDGRIDLFTHEDTGYYLYRRVDGTFQRERVHVGPFHRADVKGLTGNTYDYWQFDGKLSVTDIDNDGDLDVFVASKRGNVLLLNDGGRFRSVAPATLGLPQDSVAATWADVDNDGRVDLHVVPEGVYRQTADGRFTRTGLLAMPALKFQAAIINWFDRDNDGRLDVVTAVQENASLWRWWERLSKRAEVTGQDDRFDWKLESFRNRHPTANWLQLRLVGPAGNPEAIGAFVTLTSRNGKQARQVGSHDGAYLSQGHYRLYFGLGADSGPVRLDITWPDGRRQTLDNVSVDRLLTVHRPN